jgi:hypothetical protein
MRTLHKLLLLALALPTLAQEPAEIGPFLARFDAANAYLPTSLVWRTQGRTIELINPRTGLNLSFTDFEFRSKFYREENRNIWSAKAEPRFTVEPRDVSAPEKIQDGDFTGFEVRYTHSIGTVRRRILASKTAPTLQIEYRIEAGRDVLIHEPDMFGVTLNTAPGFTGKAVPLAGSTTGELLTCTNTGEGVYSASLLSSGPAILTDPLQKVCLLVSGEVETGTLTNGIPTRLLRIRKGDRFGIRLAIQCFAGNDQAGGKAMQELAGAMKPSQIPFLLVQSALLYRKLGLPAEAEKALLRAAELDKDYAAPYAMLAALRRDTPFEPGVKQEDAWCEAAYRMPYNYGYILSGGGLANDVRLTEEQRRLGMLNQLIAVENTVFYPDYYIWAARPFEKMNMPAQACAMYRQALWAVDYMPRSEETKAKLRTDFAKKIDELSHRLLTERAPELPPLTPVRVK